MTTVTQVLHNKPEQAVYTIAPDATKIKTKNQIKKKEIGALVVTHEDGVVGILSERDYTRKIALMERTSFNTTVNEIMTAKVLTITRAFTVEECLELITDKHLRHLPIVENGQLIGLISIGDLVKAAMEDQKKLIDQLQQYISG